MIRFREKEYSNIRTETARGAGLGAAIAVGVNKLMKSAIPDVVKRTPAKKDGKFIYDNGKQVFNTEVLKEGTEIFKEGMEKAAPKVEAFLSKFGEVGKWLKGANRSFWDNLTKLGAWIMSNPSKAAIAGAAIGASLAAGYYLIKAAYNKADQKLANTSGRMLDKVCKVLEKMGYKRNQDFTTDPVQADYLRTKVCIVVSSTKDELNITVNSINDPKLEPVARQIIKNLPSGSKFYQRQSDKSNELTLAVTGSNNGDHTYIATVVERFIKKKYPVFIIEIN